MVTSVSSRVLVANSGEDQRKAPKPQDRIESLTSLRFFACFFMVFYHAHAHFFGSSAELNHDTFTPLLAFFFALSGFVIAHNYSSLADVKSVLRFYIFRYSRMLPVHILTMCLFLFTLSGIFNPKIAGYATFFSNLTMTHAWVPWSEYFFSYNSPSWSNSTELFFYLCFPILLFAMRKRWWLPLLIGALSTVAMIIVCNVFKLPHISTNSPCVLGLVFVHPIGRIFEFALGMTVALFFREHLRPLSLSSPVATALEFCGLAWVLLAAFNGEAVRYHLMPFLGDAGSMWVQSAGLPVVGCALLIGVLATEKGLIARILNWRLLIVAGEASFSMYMLHSFFLTYASVHFPQSLSVQAYVVFWALLLVSGHFVATVIDPPLRKRMIKLGTALIGNDATTEEKLRRDSKPARKIGLLQRLSPVVQLALIVWLVWLYLPAVDRIDASVVENGLQSMPVKAVAFPPYLECRGACAVRNDEGVRVKMYWQAKQSGPLKFFVKATALDESGAEIGCRTYTVSPRQEAVKTGTCWEENLTVCVSPGVKVKSISILLLRKHAVVPAQTTNAVMTIPVASTVASEPAAGIEQ